MPRGQRSRTVRQKQLSLAPAMIPNKVYFRIGEVSHLTETKSYILRYWETEFPTLKPVKSRTGYRLYRRQDVQTVFEIKKLLQEKGFTIQGARAQLARSPKSEPGAAAESQQPGPNSGSALDAQALKSIEHELRAVLTILSRK